MKKALSVFMVIVLAFVLVACGDANDTSSDIDTNIPAQVENSDFAKPENYASVITVTINPQFRLYLDAFGVVLAVEPVNDDAKSIADKLTANEGSIENVIESIVIATKDGGFVKDGAEVKVDMTEIKDTTINTEEVLNKAKATAENTFNELKIIVEVKVSAEEPETNVNSEVTSSIEDSSHTSTPAPDNEASHKHSFSGATCTRAAACSCGATSGKALGHNYKNGVCSRCSAKDPNFAVSYTSITQKNGDWIFKYVVGTTLYSGSFKLNGDDINVGVGYGDLLSTLPEEFQEEAKPDCEIFEGEYYYVGRGDGDGLKSVAENGNTVTVTDLSGNQLVLTRTAENTLKVKTSASSFAVLQKIPVGTVLTLTTE